jgi:pimeloyl-ACP methyl ester carboxylesterase
MSFLCYLWVCFNLGKVGKNYQKCYNSFMKVFIDNRNNKKLSVIVEENLNPKGLVFISHGLGGFKEQDHIQAFADAFKENEFTVIRFDAANSIGESEGKYENATLSSYYEDLEDIIKWAKEQSWYREPFWLAGHSLGAISVALYAEKHPEEVRGLAPISTVVSGALSIKNKESRNTLEEWKKTGWQTRESKSKPGIINRLPWSHMEDRLAFDLLPNVDKLTMPVLMIVGSEDESTPLEHQKILYEKLPGKKELHIIQGAQHTFRKPEHLEEVKTIFDEWIKNNL